MSDERLIPILQPRDVAADREPLVHLDDISATADVTPTEWVQAFSCSKPEVLNQFFGGVVPERGTPAWFRYLSFTVSVDKLQTALLTYAASGSLKKAAREANLSTNAIRVRLRHDDNFARAWDEAREIAACGLEDEARRRAVDGVDEPVFFQGEVVGYSKRYSDSLLIMLLKGVRPELRETLNKHELSGSLGLEQQVADAAQRLDKLLGINAEANGAE